MSDDPDKTTAGSSASDARGAELRENLARTDARRAEEQHAKAEEDVERARKKADELEEKERREKEKAERLHAEAEKARQQSGAGLGAPAPPAAAPPPPQSAAAGLPGADRLPEAAQRPEVLVGIAFVGSFLVARILKRIFD